MAESFIRALDQRTESDHGQDPPADFLQPCKDMVCTEYGQYIGVGYVGG